MGFDRAARGTSDAAEISAVQAKRRYTLNEQHRLDFRPNHAGKLKLGVRMLTTCSRPV